MTDDETPAWVTATVKDIAATVYGNHPVEEKCKPCKGLGGWMNPTGGFKEFSGTYPKWQKCHACDGKGSVTPFDAGAMMILADALEEAGAPEEVVRHARGYDRCNARGPHHDDPCNWGRVQSPNAQFTQHCRSCSGSGWRLAGVPRVRGDAVVDFLLGKQ